VVKFGYTLLKLKIMTEEEIGEYNNKLLLLAGISLPGVIGRASFIDRPEIVARDAFDIAEAMLVELDKRKKSCTQE
jgi:hypothetical protein